MRSRHATHSVLVTANNRSHAYTDSQVKALSDRINQLQADLHKSDTKTYRMDMATDLVGVVAAVALAFSTSGMSLIALAPIALSQVGAVVPIIAKWIAGRRGHTRNPFTPFRSGEKTLKNSSDVTNMMTDALTQSGLDSTIARLFSEAVITKTAAATAAGRFPGDESFLTPEDKKLILSAIDPVVNGRITMKVADLAGIVKSNTTHVGAGSSQGGQFAPAGGGAAGDEQAEQQQIRQLRGQLAQVMAQIAALQAALKKPKTTKPKGAPKKPSKPKPATAKKPSSKPKKPSVKKPSTQAQISTLQNQATQLRSQISSLVAQ